jgi:UDP-N-acetylglucosamine--N-acetylmuramyl-(pentapeptide) pyrophosphoryl-undecaprenol N-acetylglucosamine transferase
MNKPKSLFIVAAGSGGHILPALVLAKQWTEIQTDPAAKVYLFTSTTTLDQNIAHNHPFITEVIGCSLSKFSVKRWWLIPQIIFQVIMTFCKTLIKIGHHHPEKIVSTGGLLSIPVCLAAFFFRVPVELYELNVIPGKATTILLPFVTTVFTVFDTTKKLCRLLGKDFSEKCQEAAYPLRFSAQDNIFDPHQILREINKTIAATGQSFLPCRKTLFVIGGSQGSALLNKLVRNACIHTSITGSQVQIIHQTGAADQKEWQTFYAQHNIAAHTFSFDPNIARFYQIADLVIARAGAGTLFEIEFFKKKCLVIPLVAKTTTHQVDNAVAMEKEHPDLFTMLLEEKIKENGRLFDAKVIQMLELQIKTAT